MTVNLNLFVRLLTSIQYLYLWEMLILAVHTEKGHGEFYRLMRLSLKCSFSSFRQAYVDIQLKFQSDS